MAEVVFSGVNDGASLHGNLFLGIKFWLSQRVPQRGRFINDIRANGGEVLPIEKHADVKIVDHARKEALPGTHSYTFIERSVRKGVLEDLADHTVGPPEGVVRSVGSVAHPAKTTRNKYTVEDDRILWNWVHTNPQKGGGTEGNEIYKQLEAKARNWHPQHPWQSWRDRWVKQLKSRPDAFPLPHNAPPTPPSDIKEPMAPCEPEQRASEATEDDDELFTEEDAQSLMEMGEEIMAVPKESTDKAWQAFAEADENGRSAKEWRSFWEDEIRFEYLRKRRKKVKKGSTKNAANSKAPEEPTSTLPFSPRKPSDARASTRSPSYHPESPQIHFQDRPMPPQAADAVDNTKAVPSRGLPSTKPLYFGADSTQTLKRKPSVLEEEFPSSSPPEASASPKRTRFSESKMPREIASTPDRSPRSQRKEPEHKDRYSPLFVDLDSEDEDPLEDIPEEKNSLPGQEPSEQESEPDHDRGTTQNIFREPSPYIDFDVAPPGDDWEADPQVPESPPPDTASSQSDINAQVDAWIDSYVAKGYTFEQVVSALKATSIDTELSEKVLDMVGKNGDLPQDWKGVWTVADDEDLQSADARKVQRLQNKHGEDIFNARFEFLEFYEAS